MPPTRNIEVKLAPPPLMRLADAPAIMSAVALLVATGAAKTRPELARATGLARSTIGAALHRLERIGLITAISPAAPTGRGRPAETLGLNPDAGVILVLDLTPHHIRVAVVSLEARILAVNRIRFDLAEGPEATLGRAAELVTALMRSLDGPGFPVRAVVASLPGPVDTRLGRPVCPPIMPKWDDFPVTDWLADHFGAPALADNDVNLMALGEARALPPDQCPLLFVKVGTGIGGGLVTADRQLHRGADGSACDIGHLRVSGAEQAVCACGNVGCVEAVASAEAIKRRLQAAQGAQVTRVDLNALAKDRDPLAVSLIKEAAGVLGETVAALVHICNPARVVLGGSLSAASDDLLAGVRAVVYQRALPLATRNLTLAHSQLGDLAGIYGAAVLGAEHVLSPEALAGPTAAGAFPRPTAG